MTLMSWDLALTIFADRIPFLVERHYLQFPEIEAGAPLPKPVDDIWTSLALLLERRNDRTRRVLLRQNCSKNRHGVPIIRVGVYSSGYTREEWSGDHDFPLTEEVVKELIRNNYIQGTPYMGYTDETELTLTERGRQDLFEHIRTLS